MLAYFPLLYTRNECMLHAACCMLNTEYYKRGPGQGQGQPKNSSMASRLYVAHYRVTLLRDWLMDEAPTNVLIPTEKGKKAPKHCHKNDAWTWAKFDASWHVKGIRWNSLYDVGILLRDLCVIDVDDLGICAELERDYPELLRVPCEQTSKGMHYFFRRSALADTDGYYDGAAQVMKGVDFKSVCHNGTAGFVVVSPSTGKAWTRPPWCNPLEDIGDDLLKAVALPRHACASVNLTCMDDTFTLLDNKHVIQFSTVRHACEDFPGQSITIPFPRPLLDELLLLCEHNVSTMLPNKERVHELLQLADYLGVPSCRLAAFRAGGYVHRLLDVVSVWPTMAEHMHDDIMYRAGIAEPPALVPVSDIDSTSIDIKIDEPWLFGPNTCRMTSTVVTKLMVPTFVEALLRKYPNKIVLAGGGALATVIESTGPPYDYDLFMVHVTEEEGIRMVDAICRSQCKIVRTSSCAVTLHAPPGIHVQIILRRYQSGAHLLASFDMQPCKVLIRCIDGELVAEAAPSWVTSIRAMCFVPALDMWGSPSFVRVLKYASRGFRVYVPCTDRACINFRPEFAVGVGELFAFEARRPPGVPFPAKEEILHAIRKRKKRYDSKKYMLDLSSDYDTSKKLSDTLLYWYRWITGVRFVPNLNPGDLPMATGNNFFPMSLRWGNVYDLKAWRGSYINMLDLSANLKELIERL